jgi:uncharacterized protein (DUF1501 family)
MDRRTWLKTCAIAGGALLLPIGRRGWAASTAESVNSQRLIVVMLRGAVDGLSVVVPYSENAYYQARSRIAIGKPGTDGGALDLDGRFGLHPALAPLLPYWKDRSLAFVHASGSPAPSRSHFEAQDFMESGTPGVTSTNDGWMNRLLGQLPGTHASTSAISLGDAQPRIVSGRQAVANVALGRAAVRPLATDRPLVGSAFDHLYDGDDALARAYREGRQARKDVLADLHEDAPEDPKASGGAPPAQGFAQDAQQLARILRNDTKVRMAFLAIGGWDTHVNQGNAKGQLATRLAALGDGLDTLLRELGSLRNDTTIVVMSEFGRTVHENGNAGSDHGHGNAMWLLGGGVVGGKIYGEWPGLDDSGLYERRDLAITTDFRSVLANVCERRLRLSDKALSQVFPQAPAVSRRLDGMTRTAAA